MEKYPEFPVLLVDDEPSICFSISSVLRTFGINNIISCSDSEKVIDTIGENNVKIILLDLIMPGKKGEELLVEINDEFPEAIVIVVTGNDNLNTAVHCMRSGAFDYIVKPVDENLLVPSVNRAIKMQELQLENKNLTEHILDESLGNPSIFSDIITNNQKMKRTFQYCEAIAPSPQAALITGETGTGKELFAQALHKLSGRSGKFVPVNVSGLDSNMFSDTLFGHVKGAYTGAANHRKGMVEKAKGGTLFLDEIGDLDMGNQVKLLRLLQEHEYMPLGSDTAKLTDAKIVVATHKDVEQLMMEGLFRKDLYYRLKTHRVHLPPLRDRKDDIPLLLNNFLREAALEMNKKIPTYSPELITYLNNYDFPGNIRELRGMVYDAVAGHKSKMLSMEVFRKSIKGFVDISPQLAAAISGNIFSSLEKLPSLKDADLMLVDEAMKRSGGNQSAAAVILGVSQQALSRRMKNKAQ